MPLVDPHPVIVTIRNNKDYTTVLSHSYHTTIPGWRVLLHYAARRSDLILEGQGVTGDKPECLKLLHPKLPKTLTQNPKP